MSQLPWYKAWKNTATVYEGDGVKVDIKSIKVWINDQKKANIAITIEGYSDPSAMITFLTKLHHSAIVTVYPVPADFTGDEDLKDDDPPPLGRGAIISEYTYSMGFNTITGRDPWEIKPSTGNDNGSDAFWSGMRYFAVAQLSSHSIRSGLQEVQRSA